MSSPLQTTLGAMEIGTIIGAMLMGVNILQVFIYFRNFPEDRLGLKVLVATVFVLDIAHTAVLMQSLFHYTVTGYGDVRFFEEITTPYLVSALLTGTITFIVQAFYSYRVYFVTRSATMAVLCASIATVRFGFSIGASGQAFVIHSFIGYGQFRHWPIIVYSALGAASDALNAGTLCITLARNRTGHGRTDKVVDKVIAYTISTGLLTSIVTISELICYVSMHNFIWLAQLAITAKLFANSLLASLNARGSLREDMKSTVVSSFRVKMGPVTDNQSKHNELEINV